VKIAITGTTGVGKSTTIKELNKILLDNGYDVIVAGELVADSPLFSYYFDSVAE
jgi:broad-specificity NMP kinase